ncbi:MAG: sugar transferase [Propionibacteriaceae bacterium]|jgi:exopolysaccharide biosynthesis polyprenyl glycosylphosphotransferase|nr:sugar transferase [Propionibacteriaceae bacterium]
MSDLRPPRASYAQPVLEARKWQRAYALRLRVTDTILVIGIVVASYIVRYRWGSPTLQFDDRVAIDYRIVSAILIAAWLVSLWALGTRDQRIIGTGPTEYSRVGTATMVVYGLLALVALSFKLEPGRAFILMTFLGGMALLPAGRWLWRQWLAHSRATGQNIHRALVLGSREKCLHTAEGINRDPSSGYQVVAAIVDEGGDGELMARVPLLGPGNPVAIAEAAGADTVVYAGSVNYDPRDLRELGWQVEARHMGLIVAPGLTDIAGPRIATQVVAGLPLVQIDYPTLEGGRFAVKRGLDVLAAGLLLIALSPVFLVIALAVKLTSPGPVLFRQERVGRNGQPFKMLKFRSMVVGAHKSVPQPTDGSDHTSARDPFKLKNDPRVTKVGGFLRRYSLDELPQLVNVLKNDMSLVGPRPQVEREVQQYDDAAFRRLLVKPGITGLWQVSGRSDLSWEDSIRLDLYYVENWSVAGDLVILWRTIKAVLRPDGAY